MGKFVLKRASVTVNSVDLSDHVREVSVETTTPEVDVTAMQSAYQEFAPGIPDATITVTFFQDFDAGEIDATLWPLNGGASIFPVVVKPTDASTSSTNPTYTMPAARLFGYNPISGGVGSAAETPVTFRNAGTAGITRATA